MTTLAVLQPGYLPWLGFFDQVARADVFVIYDDVQYDHGGWRNRNRVKSRDSVVWLTVPVLHSNRMGQSIDTVEIAPNTHWARKHLTTIAQAYARAPFLLRYLPELEAILMRPWQRLVDLDMALIASLCGWLDLNPPEQRASTLGIAGGRSSRLIALCQHFGADTYLSGNAAKSYLDIGAFAAAGISVEWQNYSHPVYPQQHGPFVSHLSVLDLLLNVGPDSARLVRSS